MRKKKEMKKSEEKAATRQERRGGRSEREMMYACYMQVLCAQSQREKKPG